MLTRPSWPPEDDVPEGVSRQGVGVLRRPQPCGPVGFVCSPLVNTASLALRLVLLLGIAIFNGRRSRSGAGGSPSLGSTHGCGR